MRYNSDTERGISLEEIAAQCLNAIKPLACQPQIVNAQIWDCRNGGWVNVKTSQH